MPPSPDARELDRLASHVEGVRRLARSLVSDAHRADDVAQEALLVALERPPPSTWNLRAWLFGVVRNKARRTFRDDARRRTRERSVARTGSVPSAAELSVRIAEQKRLLDAVLGLPEKYNTVVWLRYFDGLPPRVIAERLGHPVETVRTRLRRAIDLLRGSLDRAHGGDRRAWTLALAPLTAGGRGAKALPLLGGVGMATGMKTGLVVASVLAALALAGGGIWLAVGRSASAPAPLEQAERRDGGDALGEQREPGVRLAGRPDDAAAVAPRTFDAEGGGPASAASLIRRLGAAEPGTIVGQVVDHEGHPLPHAYVLLMSEDAQTGTKGSLADASGAFRFEDLGSRPVTMLVRRSGNASAAMRIDPGTEVRVALTPGLHIQGVVVDAQNDRPVAGARVRTVEVRTPTAVWHREDRTRADGHFTLRDLAGGAYGLEVTPPRVRQPGESGEYVSRRVAAVRSGTTDLRIALEPGLSIGGVVYDAKGDTLVARVGVRVWPASGRRDEEARNRFVRSDAKGRFVTRGLPRGLYDLRFTPELSGDSSDLRAGPVVRSGVPAGRTDLHVTLIEGIPLSGCIVDEAGQPITAQGSITLIPRHRGAAPGGAIRAKLLPDGCFRTVGLIPGVRHDLEATRFPGYFSTTLRDLLPGDGEVRVVLTSGGRITGAVIRDDGLPAPAGIPVTALPAQAPRDPRDAYGDCAHALTDGDGCFTLEGLRAHPYRVLVGGRTSSFVSAGAAPVVRPPAKRVTLTVQPGVPFRGRLIDADGLPVVSDFVQAQADASRECAAHWTTAGPDGRFQFRGVPPGEIRLLVETGAGTRLLGPFTAPASDVVVRIRD